VHHTVESQQHISHICQQFHLVQPWYY
jgi:hypothetical protein